MIIETFRQAIQNVWSNKSISPMGSWVSTRVIISRNCLLV